MGAKIRAEGRASALRKPAVRLIALKRKLGRCRWKHTAAPRSRPQPSDNASTADSAGLRWNASAARRAGACRLMQSHKLPKQGQNVNEARKTALSLGRP